MALAYLLDPQLQYSDKSGALNVAGFLRVYLNGTDDRAITYKDFNGTRNTADIVLDNNGRAVVIADTSKTYRLEVYTSDGDLQWTQYPLNTIVGGSGGANGFVVESTDGSIAVDRYDSGGVIHYDLSAHVEDSTDLLEWIRCEGATKDSDTYTPIYTDGTMEVGTKGIKVSADRYYHVTAHLRASKSTVQPYYDKVDVLFRLVDDNDVETNVIRQSVIVDSSVGLVQDYEVSTDVMVEEDAELLLDILNTTVPGITWDVLNLEVHRVFSGAPVIPGGVQRKLIAGENITIEHTGSGDIISSTGGGGGIVPLSDLSGLRYSQGNTPVNRMSAENGDRPGLYGFMGIKCDPSFVWVEGSTFRTRLYLESPWFGDPSWAYVYPLWYKVADPSKYICATNKNFYALHDNGMVADPVADTTYYVVDVDVYSYDLTWSQPDLITSLDELATSDWAFTYVSYGTSGRFPTGEDGVSWNFAQATPFSGWIPDGKMYAYLKNYGGLNTDLGGLYVDPNYFQKKLTAGTGITIDGNTISADTSLTPVLVGSAEGYVAASGDTNLPFSRPRIPNAERYVYPNKLYMLRCRIGYGDIAESNTLTFGDNPQLILCSFDNSNDPLTMSYSGRLFAAIALPKTPTLIDNAHVGERFDAMVDFFDVPTDTVCIEWFGYLPQQTGEELRVILKDVTMGSGNHMHLYVDLYRLN